MSPLRVHSSIPRSLRRCVAVLLAGFVSVQAAPIDLDLLGTVDYDAWINLTAANYPNSGGFPGTGAWPTSGNWTSYGTLGAIGSNTAGSGDAMLYKISNGAGGGGGPYPAGGSIYFGGFSSGSNINGGTLGVVDTSPLSGLKTIAFQIDIGEAFGYDFLNHTLPTLTYTTASGTSSPLTASFSERLLQLYAGEVSMPTGYEDIYRNTWGVQFDLSGITEPILSFQLSFTGVQHAQLYGLQLDQSDTKYTASAFATASAWDAGGSNTLWSTADNWAGDIQPVQGKEVSFAQGTSAVLDSSQTVRSLALKAAGSFDLTQSNGAVLTVGEGGITAAAPGTATYTIAAPMVFTDMHLVTVAANTNLVLAGSLTAPGFYKSGEGTLKLTGNNTFTGNTYNRLIFNGGSASFSGTNTYTGAGSLEILLKDSTLTLHGGDNRLGANFKVDLTSNRIVNNTTVLSEKNAHLILGDAGGRSNQTLAGLKADLTTIFNETTSIKSSDTSSKASVTGGNAAVSTLTLNVADGTTVDYWGRLGGSNANEDQLAITKKGAGVQSLGGTSTYTGDTVVEEGLLRINSATALSANSQLILGGGVLGLGAGNFTRTLGTGANQVTFAGDGGFSAHGAVRTVNLGGAGATVTWGSGSFVGNGNKLVLSSTSSDNTVEFENPVQLGSQVRTVRVDNGAAAVDARLTGALSGTGGLEKTGSGNLELTAANTYEGKTLVKEGALALAGTSGAVKGDVTVSAGATFQLTNTETANHADRVADDATVTLKGGLFNFSNPATGTTPSYSETVGELALDAGANTVAASQAVTGNTATLMLTRLSRLAGATVNFTGTGLGLDTRNRVLITQAPVLDHGLIGGWATVGNEFATYGANGVTALAAGSYTTTGESSWVAANNVKVSGATTTTLTSGRQINSLNLVGPTTGAVGNVVNLNSNVLRVESGGILTSGGASTRQTVIRQGTLTAGNGDNAEGELVITANGVTQVEALVTNNGTGEVSLVKAGSNTLTLTANNTYSGDTTVNQGTLNINGNQTGGRDLVVNKSASLEVNGSVEVNGTMRIDGTYGGSGSINLGAGTKLTGSGTFNKAFTVGAGAGKVSVLAPGNSPGTLTTLGQTWTSGGTYLWEINATGVTGSNIGQNPGWDFVNITGGLDLTALTAGAFEIDITSLTSADESGLLAGFDSLSDYSWTILSASGGILGFEESDFVLNTEHFTNSFTGGDFSLSQSGNSLVLNYTSAVPEPGRALLLLFGLGSVFLRRRR